jgi:hypothetical protein
MLFFMSLILDLSLRKEQRFRMFENHMLRIIASKKVGVRGRQKIA